MSSLYLVKFNTGVEMPPEAFRDSRRFDFDFTYDLLNSKPKTETNIIISVAVPGLQAIGLGQSVERILYWLAVQNLPAFIAKQATGRQLVELSSIPSFPEPATIEYPPTDAFFVEVNRKIGFGP
jgi:hypothetical protein